LVGDTFDAKLFLTHSLYLTGLRRQLVILLSSVINDSALVKNDNDVREMLTLLALLSEPNNIDVYFECVLNRRLNISIELTIYRIIQEALTNIRKYAEVTEATVTVRELDDIVRVMVEDKGKGFEIKNQSVGVGLFSMDERARSVGGELFISSSPGMGTKLILEVPISIVE